jgi:hypothetical protein
MSDFKNVAIILMKYTNRIIAVLELKDNETITHQVHKWMSDHYDCFIIDDYIWEIKVLQSNS